jgi:hypothetical protein
MKTVSTAFKAAQKSPASVSVRRVSYKRRYWVQATNSYTWEASWTLLPENEVVSVSPITGKLDTDRLNEFKISNVNLVLKNERRQWKAGKRGGYFGATDTYTDGFEPYWTKFKIESGYELDGVATYTPMFVGVAVDFKTESSSDTLQVDVRGLEAILENANAENVSTLVGMENMGTGNGSNKDFTTVHPGVGIIKEVYLDGNSQKVGTDYKISQLNEPTLGAKISFTTAPAGGVVVRINYIYWKQDVTIDSIVKDLLTEAGVPLGNQNVDNVILSEGVITKQIETSATDFDAGTYDGTEGSSSPGSIKINYENAELLDDFSDGNFTSNPTWTNVAGWSIVGNEAKAGSAGWALYTSSNRAFGEWRIRFTQSGGSCWQRFYFIANGITATSGFNLNQGYFMEFMYAAGGSTSSITISRHGTGTSITILGVLNVTLATVNDIRIVREPSGTFKVYHNSVLAGTVTGYLAYTTSLYVGVSPIMTAGTFDNVYIPTTSLSGTHTSRIIDLGFEAASYANLNYTSTLNGGTITFETRSSVDGLSWGSWLPYSGSIASDPHRYIQVRSTLTSASPSTTSPSLDEYSFDYTSTSTTIKMANMTGKTVYEAIQSFGEFANYEWGFNETEDFFFRSKESGITVDDILDSSVNLIGVTNISDGVDRVFSEVKAKFGEYEVTVGDDGVTKDGPIARFGKRRLEVNSGDILLAPDKDVATGVAHGLYLALKNPKRTMKCKAKLMEWLDLSDTVSVTFNDNIPPRPWFFGDTSAYYGDTTIYFFGDSDQTFKDLICKVVGYRHDTENKTSEFDLEEILV